MEKLEDGAIVHKGELIWQGRQPGGVCVYMGIVTKETSKHQPSYWTKEDEPVYLILHPEEGLIEDPSYYYTTLEDEEKYSRVRLKYELKKAGRAIPDWLDEQIKKDDFYD